MTKIEGVPEGYELVRIGAPVKDELVIMSAGDVQRVSNDFVSQNLPIVRKIEPPKPIEPPEGYRLLDADAEDIIRPDFMHIGSMREWNFSRHFVGETVRGAMKRNKFVHGFARKIEPQVRPMTRDEFLAAWKQRNFCPLIDSDGDIDTVSYVTDDTEFDRDCVDMFNAGWCSMDELSRFKFASDETYLIIEE